MEGRVATLEATCLARLPSVDVLYSNYEFSCCDEDIIVATKLSLLLEKCYGEYNKPITIVEKSEIFTVHPPPAKRPKALEHDSPKPPCCSKPPSELDSNDLKKCVITTTGWRFVYGIYLQQTTFKKSSLWMMWRLMCPLKH